MDVESSMESSCSNSLSCCSDERTGSLADEQGSNDEESDEYVTDEERPHQGGENSPSIPLVEILECMRHSRPGPGFTAGLWDEFLGHTMTVPLIHKGRNVG